MNNIAINEVCTYVDQLSGNKLKQKQRSWDRRRIHLQRITKNIVGIDNSNNDAVSAVNSAFNS